LTFGGSAFADRHPATGDFDGNINVWDLENKIPGKYSQLSGYFGNVKEASC